VGNLGSSAIGFVVFMLLTPLRVDGGVVDCVEGTPCPGDFRHCYTLLGWEDVLGPLSCSRWAAVGVGLLVGLCVRGVGSWRVRHRRGLRVGR
jgi:hypothetical protein